MLDEWTINRLGYHYLSRKEYTAAEILFRFNIDKFSNSANANDSMAEYYYRTDQYKKAAEYYEKVLLIDSKHQNARFIILDKISGAGR
jgi:Tfp pilus assembly protein PilF